MAEISYRRHRFPPVIIQHAVWLYLRFTLSYRDVEELLAERGLDISYESVRSWVLKFGPMIARRLRRVRPRPSDRWHLDEMVVRIAGKRMYLWRAVDHEGEILEVLVQRRRDRRAAVKLMRKLMRKQGFAPKRVVTDKLRSYGAAFQHLRLSCHHEQGLRERPVVVPVLLVHGRKPPAYVLSAEILAGEEQRSSFGTAADQFGMDVRIPNDAELVAWGAGVGHFPSDPPPSSAGQAIVVGTLDWSETSPGWIGKWRMRWQGADYAWGISGVNYDAAFRNIVRGVVLVASGVGSPDQGE